MQDEEKFRVWVDHETFYAETVIVDAYFDDSEEWDQFALTPSEARVLHAKLGSVLGLT